MLILILYGVFGVSEINRQILPSFDVYTVIVSIRWPGASPKEVESNVIAAVESEIRFLDEVLKVKSLASEGRADVQVEFSEHANMSKALAEVQAAIARVKTFPSDIETPVVEQLIVPIQVSRISINGPFSENALKSVAKRMRDDLMERGMSRIEIDGARNSEIWVEVADGALRRLDMTLEEIAKKISEFSLDLPAGSIETSGSVHQIRTEALARTVDDIKQIEILSTPEGNKLNLGEIADISDAFEANSVSRFIAGSPAIGLVVFRSEESDSIVSQRIVEEYVNALRSELPSSINVQIFDVLADQTSQRVRMLVNSGIGGLLLVLAVLLVFLNYEVAFWITMGIPVAILAAVGMMSSVGLSLNLISMFALIMGLGIVVDDAIIVGEHAERLYFDGASADDAAVSAAKAMFVPVLAASLTTVATFLPMLLIGRELGQIIRDLPLTMIFLISFSLIECFLILPSHLRKSLANMDGARVAPRRGRFGNFLEYFRNEMFTRFVGCCIDRRYETVLGTVIVLGLALLLLFSGHVRFDVFPPVEEDLIFANVSMAPGTPRERTMQVIGELGRALKAADTELAGDSGSLVKFAYGAVGRVQDPGNRTGDHVGSFTAELISSDNREIRTQQFLAAWRKKIDPLPGIENLIVFENNDAPGGKDVDIRLRGANLTVLKSAAIAIRRSLRNIPGVFSIEDNLPYGKDGIVVTATPRGFALGFTNELIARELRDAFEGRVAKRFSQNQEEVKVRVKLKNSGDSTIDTIREVYLRAPDGTVVPLTEVVSFSVNDGFSQISRENGSRQVSVTASVDRLVTTPNEVLALVSRDIAPAINRDFGVDVFFKGQAEQQASVVYDALLAFLAAMLTIYIILAWVFSSYTTPFLVMSVIPFGFVGALIGHWLLGLNFGFLSMMALLGLSGVIINDSIILVLAIKRLLMRGEKLREAIVTGARDRLRPILLTTITSVVGLTPLLFGRSVQAQLIHPLAVTMIFGLLFSPFLVLIFLPSLLGIGTDIRYRLSKLFSGA